MLGKLLNRLRRDCEFSNGIRAALICGLNLIGTLEVAAGNRLMVSSLVTESGKKQAT